jgi:hypothetical protein
MTTRAENPYAGQGAVLLDIGGDVGAMVVAMSAALDGLEVEVRPVRGHSHPAGHHHRHVAVVNRPIEGGSLPSLVFPELVAGSYDLAEVGSDFVRLRVDVAGGQVAFATWPPGYA